MFAHDHRSGMAGSSLVDVMIGLAIGLLAIVIVYQAFVAADKVRRAGAAAADMQASGAFALFALAAHIGNGGAGLAAAARWLDTCPPTADVATTLRPIDVLISDGGRADRPDTAVIRQSLASAPGMPAAFAVAAPAGSSFQVESPDGFAVGDRVIAVDRRGGCTAAQILAVGAPAAGIVGLAHSPVAVDLPATSVLLNLGPAGLASTTRYDVVAGNLNGSERAHV
jgi:type IV pilus assembly protein PilW